jgi:hypothetical protein
VPISPRAPLLFGLRFAAGTLGSVASGLILGPAVPGLGRGIFDPSRPAFQILAVGALFALVQALVRARRPLPAVVLSSLVGAMAMALSLARGPAHAISNGVAGLAVGGGIFLIAVLYDAMADLGYPVGKFLVTGPLLGGVFLAATPLSGLGGGPPLGLVRACWINAFVGIVIGEGVGFGVEVAELAADSRRSADAGREPPGPPD